MSNGLSSLLRLREIEKEINLLVLEARIILSQLAPPEFDEMWRTKQASKLLVPDVRRK